MMTNKFDELAMINERTANADFYCSRLQKIACNLANFLRKNSADMAELEKAIDEFEERINIVIA